MFRWICVAWLLIIIVGALAREASVPPAVAPSGTPRRALPAVGDSIGPLQLFAGRTDSSHHPARNSNAMLLVLSASCGTCRTELEDQYYSRILEAAAELDLNPRVLLVLGQPAENDLFTNNLGRYSLVLDSTSFAFDSLGARVAPSIIFFSRSGAVIGAHSPSMLWPVTREMLLQYSNPTYLEES
jgi:hypothetical protein